MSGSDPAFPSHEWMNDEAVEKYGGLTKRELFAALNHAQIIGALYGKKIDQTDEARKALADLLDQSSSLARIHADALLTELEKHK